MLEADDEVVCPTNNDNVALRQTTSPSLNPQVEGIVQIYVRKEGANAPALWCPSLRLVHHSIFKHACFQPLFDQTYDAPVSNPVLEEPYHPFVVDGIEETTDVGIEHPAHLPLEDSEA